MNKNIESAAKNVSAYLYVRLQLAIRECPDSSQWGIRKIPAKLGNQTFLEYIKAPLIELGEALRAAEEAPEAMPKLAVART